MKKPVALIIRDGWGIAPGASLNGFNEQYTLEQAKKEGNAIKERLGRFKFIF